MRKVKVKHLKNNKLIYFGQHSFKMKRNTFKNLLVYIGTLTETIDNQILVDVNYLDCRKTYNTVPYMKLIKGKYKHINIYSKILQWIRTFLNRTVYQKSNKLRVTSEVIKDSVLGPVLFIYIN